MRVDGAPRLFLPSSFPHSSLLRDPVFLWQSLACKVHWSRKGSRTGPFSDFVSHFQEHELPWLPKPGLLISNICSRCQINQVVPSQPWRELQLFRRHSPARAIASPAATTACGTGTQPGSLAPVWEGNPATGTWHCCGKAAARPGHRLLSSAHSAAFPQIPIILPVSCGCLAPPHELQEQPGFHFP